MSVLYHVAPFECRASIREKGLSSGFCEIEVWSDQDTWDDGTYLWETRELAEEYRRDSFPVPADIYQVHMNGLPVHPDLTGSRNTRLEGAWFCPEIIPFNRLHLTAPLEQCLYHGTSRDAWEQIREEGLTGDRRGVYLTNDFRSAVDYASSRASSPENMVVIRVTGPEMSLQPNGSPAPPYFRDSWHEDTMFGFAWELDGVVAPGNLRLAEIPEFHMKLVSA